MKRLLNRFLLFGIVLIPLFPLWGCRSASVRAESGVVIQENPGPPSHAPAHGYRRKQYSYIYYPECSVYFDIGRNLYFYFDMGLWKSASILPSHITFIKNGGVNLELDIDMPYLKIHEHRKQFPPGKARQKMGQKPSKAKGKGKWK
ncbi:hypothetical protein JW926_06880 [Candidatus Sumerlaeota bacterium]|nr:hypothetical protein [Candidatus Sumerlaeota bacterium]